MTQKTYKKYTLGFENKDSYYVAATESYEPAEFGGVNPPTDLISLKVFGLKC